MAQRNIIPVWRKDLLSYFEDSVFLFTADLQNYPSLQDKFISLTANPHRYQQYGSSNSFMRYVLPWCLKLEILKLNIDRSNHTYVKKLNNMIHLPHLKQFYVKDIGYGRDDYTGIMEKLRGPLIHLDLVADRQLELALKNKNVWNISCFLGFFAPY